MKEIFVIILTCIGFQSIAQHQDNGFSIRALGPEEMITCPIGSHSSDLYLPGDNIRIYDRKRNAGVFRDTLLNDVDPEFLPAIDFVLDFLENFFTSAVTINVGIEVGNLGGSALAGARPAFVVENFDYAPYQDTEYPIALAEKILGKDINDPEALDIIITINREFESWYLTPNDPTGIRPNQIDLASVLTHEMIHGLGFFESGFVDEEGLGSLSGFLGRDHPAAYDRNIVNGNGQFLYKDFESPSVEMFNQFTSNNLFYKSETSEIKGTIPELFAPAEYAEGSSLSHLGERYNGGRDALMTFAFGGGEVIYFPGDFTLDIMYDMGWDATRIIHEPALFSEDVNSPYAILANVEADSQFDPASFKLHYSTDTFTTEDIILDLTLNDMSGMYEATIPAPGMTIEYQYYFEITDGRGIRRTRPGGGPEYFFTYNYGTDTDFPILDDENDVIIFATIDSFTLQVNAIDKFSGIDEVSSIVSVNGELDTITLTNSEINNGNTYSGVYRYSRNFIPSDVVEYRFAAVDNSPNANASVYPEAGFFQGEYIIDDEPPTIEHEPVLSVTNFDKSFRIRVAVLDTISVMVGENEVFLFDFLGVDEVRGIAIINNNEPDTFNLEYAPTLFGDFYEGTYNFEREFARDDKISYSIFATDLAFVPNKGIFPTDGSTIPIEVIEIPSPVDFYFNDFNMATEDFNGSGFIIGPVNGFSDDVIQSAEHPYPEGGPGQVVDFTYELIKPIIVADQESLIEFDEIALVEFGENGSRWPSDRFYDYVIVEARHLRGAEYFPLLNGYDCTTYADWRARYESALNNQGISTATPTIDLLKPRVIDIRDNGDFVAGDTLLVRFRLFSDNAAAGWGWMVDNLKIQNESTSTEDFITKNTIYTFPNPVVNGRLFIDLELEETYRESIISIHDMRGSLVYARSNGPTSNHSHITVDVRDLNKGVYVLTLHLDKSKMISRKFVIH